MKWTQEDGNLVYPGFINAQVAETVFGWDAVVKVKGKWAWLETEQEAKEWAEARMNEIKKEFILSMITQPGEGVYSFGNLVDIIGGYHGLDIWTVYHGDNATYKGTLEECKNYIVSCF